MQTQTSPRPMRPPGVLRVLVADDHRITLWGLQRMIESAHPRMELVGSATSREELVNHAALDAADVLLLDLDLGGESSIDALPEVRRRSDAHVLVLTGSDDPARHREAVLKGARGVLHKSAPVDTVLRAIDSVGAGEVCLRHDLLSQVLGALNAPPPRAKPKSPDTLRIESLTHREREVVAAVVRHTGAKQMVIAEALDMSEHTLRNHLTTIYSKLCVRGRLELHLFATEHGLAVCEP